MPKLSFGRIIANAYVWYINFKLWCKPICLQDVLYTYIYYHIILIPLRQFILSFSECNLFIVLTNVETSSLIKTAIYIILNDGNWLYIKCSSWLCSICTEYAIINAIRAFSSKRRKVNIIAFLEDKMCPKIELLLKFSRIRSFQFLNHGMFYLSIVCMCARKIDNWSNLTIVEPIEPIFLHHASSKMHFTYTHFGTRLYLGVVYSMFYVIIIGCFSSN